MKNAKRGARRNLPRERTPVRPRFPDGREEVPCATAIALQTPKCAVLAETLLTHFLPFVKSRQNIAFNAIECVNS